MMIHQTFIVFCVLTLASGYEDALKNAWFYKDSDSIDVTSAPIAIQPASYGRGPNYKAYGFKPRAIPLRRDLEPSQLERNVYYANDAINKTERLLPGNYVPITTEKRDGESQLNRVYHPKAIPLLMSAGFQRRSLDVQEEPIMEKPEGFTEASGRSLAEIMFGGDDDDEDEFDDDGEYEVEDLGNGELERKKHKKKKIKPKKLKKYMLPLLLAYKMKYFALVPVMIAGLVLLVGATGLAGFFFALFAAVMGIQKGSY